MRNNKSNVKSQLGIINYMRNSVFQNLWYDKGSKTWSLDKILDGVTRPVSADVYLDVYRAMDMAAHDPDSLDAILIFYI